MKDLDVVLFAHGTGTGSSANTMVEASAREAEIRLVGARVMAAFHSGEPSLETALRKTTRQNRIIVPVLTSAGHYFARLHEVIAAESHGAGGTTLTPPLGSQDRIVTRIVEEVRREVARQEWLVADTAVLVIGHGTLRHPESGATTVALAAALRARLSMPAAPAFLDQPPTIEEALIATDRRNVVVVPFLLGGGAHARQDVPARLRAHHQSLNVPYPGVTMLAPFWGVDTIAEGVQSAVRAAREDRVTLRAGARTSRLSRRQVELFAEAVAPSGIDVHWVPIETAGDRDQSRALDVEGLFTSEINDALHGGEIDVAVHSLKDLPLDADSGLVNAAFLPRASVEETLVSRWGKRLNELSPGARIGMSCDRRAVQLRFFRPDLVAAPIRGTVPERIAALERGEFDAVVLARAGLERLGLEARITETFNVHRFMPAPGQGAIVIQCPGDSPHLELLRGIDDIATRLSIDAEVAFARLTSHDGVVAAAFAATVNGTIDLHARVLDARTGQMRDARSRGADPTVVAEAAYELLSSRFGREEATFA